MAELLWLTITVVALVVAVGALGIAAVWILMMMQ
jgi:hypothetical protein